MAEGRGLSLRQQRQKVSLNHYNGNMIHFYNPKLKQLSRQLRKHGTLAEVLLWNQLKGRKMKGFQFARQKPIGCFIVDFYCPALNLVIEVDGMTHDYKGHADQKRQHHLESVGLSVLRFTDEEIKRHMAGVLLVISQWIEEQPPARGHPLQRGT